MTSTRIMKKIDLRHCATERLSGFVFYVLIGLIVVLGLLFRLIGYDMPYEYNFDYNKRNCPPLYLRIASYLQGLPSSINIDFETYRIILLTKEWEGYKSKNKEYYFCHKWFEIIAVYFFCVRKYKVS